MRNVLGALLALAGAAAAVLSPFRAWYDGRLGSGIRVLDLFVGVSRVEALFIASLFLPMAVAAIVALFALPLRSRALMTVSGLLVLATAAVWMGQQAATPVGLHTAQVGSGLVIAMVGGALLLLAALVMRGRGGGGRHRRTEAAAARPGNGDDTG
jgi:hypothetical protein